MISLTRSPRLAFFAFSLVACGAPAAPSSVATPCTGTVTGSASGSFSSCGFAGQPFASTTDGTSTFQFIPVDVSTNLSGISVNFEVAGTPSKGTFALADLLSAEVTAQAADGTHYLLRKSHPDDGAGQGAVSLTFSSVSFDSAAHVYYVHGSFDATMPFQNVDPNAPSQSLTLLVTF